jgi:hypothetical protein
MRQTTKARVLTAGCVECQLCAYAGYATTCMNFENDLCPYLEFHRDLRRRAATEDIFAALVHETQVAVPS